MSICTPPYESTFDVFFFCFVYQNNASQIVFATKFIAYTICKALMQMPYYENVYMNCFFRVYVRFSPLEKLISLVDFTNSNANARALNAFENNKLRSPNENAIFFLSHSVRTICEHSQAHEHIITSEFPGDWTSQYNVYKWAYNRTNNTEHKYCWYDFGN